MATRMFDTGRSHCKRPVTVPVMNYGIGPPPAKPPVARADLIWSIIMLILTFAGGAVAAFVGLFVMAFTDNCPPATCDIDTGIHIMFAGLGVAAALAVAGTVITVIRLTIRAVAWPFALITLGLCALACLVAIAGYIKAVGG